MLKIFAEGDLLIVMFLQVQKLKKINKFSKLCNGLKLHSVKKISVSPPPPPKKKKCELKKVENHWYNQWQLSNVMKAKDSFYSHSSA